MSYSDGCRIEYVLVLSAGLSIHFESQQSCIVLWIFTYDLFRYLNWIVLFQKYLC